MQNETGMSAEEMLVLVDENDHPVGAAEKIQVHREGWLHRAFSIFIFDSQGRLLLQQRAPSKYHSAGLWSNACCGHPRVGEKLGDAVHRRLTEELGFDCRLQETFSLIYREQVAPDLIEHEYDHVFVGSFEGLPAHNPIEVERCKWLTLPSLMEQIGSHPHAFTTWFKRILVEIGAAGLHRWGRKLET